MGTEDAGNRHNGKSNNDFNSNSDVPRCASKCEAAAVVLVAAVGKRE